MIYSVIHSFEDQWREFVNSCFQPKLLGSSASDVNSAVNPEIVSSHNASIQLPEEFALVVGAETKRKFELCAQYGLPLPNILSRQEARTLKYPQTKNYLLLLNPSERGASTTKSLIAKRNAKGVEMSGWCYDPQFRADHKADAYFTISDHATYLELLAYLQSGRVDEVEILHSESPTLRHELVHEGYRVIGHPKILEGLRGIY